MNPKESQYWHLFQVKPRHPGQWPFDDKITTRICRHAGREASAMLHVVLQKNRKDGLDAHAALQAVYHEPFSYWDWHGMDAEDESASKHKKQLIWERQRGFTAADGKEYRYPTPQEAWHRFRRLIEGNPERSIWVKKIAVAHWMTVEDSKWIFRNLTSLEALDLSDTPLLKQKDYTDNLPESETDIWTFFFIRYQKHDLTRNMALRLRWLGLPDFRDTSLLTPVTLLTRFLPLCTNLQTFSIRGQYREEIPPQNLNEHEYVCYLSSSIKKHTPPSVTALELRLSFPSLKQLLQDLYEKKELNIYQIGLDLGAWVQTYPLRITSKEIPDEDVVAAASKAARKFRYDSYEEVHNREVHNKGLSTSTKWLLPAPEEDSLDVSDDSKSYNSPAFHKHDARPTFKYEPYNARAGLDIHEYKYDRGKCLSQNKCPSKDPKHNTELLEDLEKSHVDTLPTMLVKLYDAGQTAALQNYNMYSLQPEWQANSTTPLHPFTLIQKRPFFPTGTKPVARGKDYEKPLPDRLPEAYAWLNTTFAWRPIFDWDYFVRPNMENRRGNLDIAFKDIQHQYGFIDMTIHNKDVLIAEVAKQFQIMRNAGIPIHVLLGRRNSNESSLYWGWPYNSDAWERSLKTPFDAGLAPVAAHIDTLSIFYDLRNPLDERRLEEIDRRQPYCRPDGFCPRPTDPWYSTENNSFRKPWQDRPSRIPKPNTQKTANKKVIGKKFRVPLASNLTSCPPTGEYADEHAYDDSDHDKSIPETLHQVARRVAFEREAVGWQRFWAEYASQMANLKELRVRMPQSFDSVGSWSLCQLLTPRKTWKMIGYADEREHMQTREDLLHHALDDLKLHTHTVEEKRWPAGRFVRRSWNLLMAEDTNNTEIVALNRGTGEAEPPATRPSVSKGNSLPPTKTRLAGEKCEKEELEKAIKQARETARKEQELEASLPSDESRHSVARDPATISSSGDIERRLVGPYGRHIRGVAQRTWRAEMRSHIEQLQDGEPARENAVLNARKAGTHSQVDEATFTRNVLRDTREYMRKRIKHFRPEDIFAPCDRMDRTNGLGLVKHAINYAAEERKRRAGLAKEDSGQTRKSGSKPPATNTTTGGLPSGPQQPRGGVVESSSDSSSSESSSSDEYDRSPARFIPAVSTQHITATQTVTTQQGSQAVHTVRTTQTTQVQQHAPTVRQLQLAEELTNNTASGQTQKVPGKEPTAEQQAAERKRLIEEKKAAVTKAEAAEKKALEEEKRREEVEKQVTAEKKKINDMEAAARKKAKDDVAAANKRAADEKAAREEAHQRADEAKNRAAAEEKKAKDRAVRKAAEQKAADEAAKAAKIAAIKAQEAAATIKALNTEETSDIAPTIEKTPPAKPTKSPKTPKGRTPKTPKSEKRKSPSPGPSDDDPDDKPLKKKKKIRGNKGTPTASTPTRRSSRIRARTSQTPVELPPNVSAIESSEGDSDDADKRKEGKKIKKEPESASDYEPPGSTKKKTTGRGGKAARGKGKAAGKAAEAAKGKKRAAGDEDEDEEVEAVVKKKPAKKKVKKAKNDDEDEDAYNG